MGEVYRAEDLNLRRDVAIKLLPEGLAEDPDRVARFEREAHLLASLNHPNIAAIHGFERDGGRIFLALELVEGEDLREVLDRGPMPLDEALSVARQIAEALEEAHARGIVHRDLKPANVKIAPDGKVKVLDFGLAKAWTGDLSGVDAGSDALTRSPTLHYEGTVAGMVLGTAGYMAPEQARGRSVDKRADIWAFGVLLWEMLTGKRLFSGETVTDVLAAVLTREPEPEALPPGTPEPVRRLVARCLRKDPGSRLPDIGAARLELQELTDGSSALFQSAGSDSRRDDAASARGRRRERWLWAALTVSALAVAGFLATRQVPDPRGAGFSTHFEIGAPEGWSFRRDGVPVPSPDGRQVVFSALRDGEPMLWVRSLGAVALRPLPGTEGDDSFQPFWSPDGHFVVFSSRGALRKISLENGTVQTLCTLPGPGGFGGGDWSSTGTLVFAAGGPGGDQVYSLPAAGGIPKPWTGGEASRGKPKLFPQFLPDGRRIFFLSSGTSPGTYLGEVGSSSDVRLVGQGWALRMYAEGHVLFVRDAALYARAFDLERAAYTGEATPVAASVASASFSSSVGLFRAAGGTLAFFSGSAATTDSQLAWVDRDGRTLRTVGTPAEYGQISLAPDGERAAVEIRVGEGEYDLWVMDLERGVASRLTVTKGEERDPVWAPDGRSVAFATRGPHGADLRRKGLRAADVPEVVANSEDEDIPESWSRDGKTMLVVRRTAEDAQSVWAVPVDREGTPEPVLDIGFRVDEPQISPDGRWLAYVSPESDRDEVYVEPYRREGLRVQVSVAGGGQPKWRGDGRELFYVNARDEMMAVAVTESEGELTVSLPEKLFVLRGVEGTGYDDYAVSADGSRFLVKQSIEKEVEPRLHLVTNWTSLLE